MASAPGKIAKKVARSREMRQPQDYSVRPPFPKAALVELANLCNHSCVFCPIEKMTRKGRHIDRQLLERVLLEAYRLGTRELGFYGGSEPFVSKQLEHFIEFSKTTGFEYVYISTNGSIPSKDRMSSVLDSGLDSIKFSVNGGDRESYLAVHGKDDFSKVIDNIRWVNTYRKTHHLELRLAISFVECDLNRETFPKLEALLEPVVDEMIHFEESSFAGQMYGIPVVRSSVPCYLPFEELHITAEGYVNACCSDYQNYLAIENLQDMSLEEAFYSQRFGKLRQMHIDDQLEGTLCHNCVYAKRNPIKAVNEELVTPVPVEWFNASTRKHPSKRLGTSSQVRDTNAVASDR